MVRRLAVRFDAQGVRSVSFSPMPGEKWLELLTEQVALRARAVPGVPVYYGFAFGRGTALVRLTSDGASARASVLLFGDEADMRLLERSRPVRAAAFELPPADAGGLLPGIRAEAALSGDELNWAFGALSAAIDGREGLLARLISAFRQAAENPNRPLIVHMGADAAQVSEPARAMAELLLRCLPPGLARSASYCTWSGSRLPEVQYTLTFAGEGALLGEVVRQMSVQVDLETGRLLCPTGEVIAPTPEETELARALLAYDVNWIDRLTRGGGAADAGRPKSVAPVVLPPLEGGAALDQYLLDWLEELDSRKALLNDQAFATYAAGQWASLADRLVEESVRAADKPDFSAQLADASALLRVKRAEVRNLGLPATAVRDLMLMAVDVLDFDTLSLEDAAHVRLIGALARARLPEDAEERLKARASLCALVFRALNDPPDELSEPLELLSATGLLWPDEVAAAQNCLARYVKRECRRRGKRMRFDGRLTVLFVLSYVRFGGTIPDYRLLRQAEDWMEEGCGGAARRGYGRWLSRLMRHMPIHAGQSMMGETRYLLLLSALLAAIGAAVVLFFR